MTGGEQGRDQDLRGDTAPVDAAGAQCGKTGTDQAAEECVRRTRRQTEQPGEQVPQDSADEAREDDQQRLRRVEARDQLAVAVLDLEDVLGDGRGDLDERKAPTRLRIAERGDSSLGLEGAPVAMDVAIALPVSWKPLVKSKPRAVTTNSTKISISTVMDRSWGRAAESPNLPISSAAL